MNETELDRMLRRAAAQSPPVPAALEAAVMARVRVDDGRARRWRAFAAWLLVVAAVAGMLTACAVGGWMAARDTTHTTPPVMPLFRDPLP